MRKNERELIEAYIQKVERAAERHRRDIQGCLNLLRDIAELPRPDREGKATPI